MLHKLVWATMLAAAGLIAPAAASERPIVNAPAGSVQGVNDQGIAVFKGLPFAAAPVGDLRWRPPAPAAPWQGVRDASKFGAACMQPAPRMASIYSWDLPAMSEDCLTLNIWSPAKSEKRPVFVWIHGGALTTGVGHDPMYDGKALAERGLIVVSVNYRLGAFGYLAHPALSAESPDGVSGNYGLLDQVAALRWIRDNIAAFGGDPANVTIAGESAGALSVMALLAAPPAQGLFHKAIVQSGYKVSAPMLRETKHGMIAAETQGAQLAAAFGATDLKSLRTADARTIVEKTLATGFFPFITIDGKILPRQLVDTFDRGEQAKVPLMAGFNSGEIRSLTFLLPKAPADAAEYEAAITRGYGELAPAFLKRYPATDIRESMLAATRDAMYGWTAERLVSLQSKQGVPSFFYYYDHGYPATAALNLHGFHAAELPYIFGTMTRTPALWPKIPDTLAERKLSQAMTDYWASFASAGVPMAKGQPQWKPYSDGKAYMHFAGKPVLGNKLLPGNAALHEAVVCRRRAAGDLAWNWNVGVISPPLPPKVAGCL